MCTRKKKVIFKFHSYVNYNEYYSHIEKDRNHFAQTNL